MTVQQFLTITSSTPPPALRQAMAAALAVEPAHRQEAFPRFYDRVLNELGLQSPQTYRSLSAILLRYPGRAGFINRSLDHDRTSRCSVPPATGPGGRH